MSITQEKTTKFSNSIFIALVSFFALLFIFENGVIHQLKLLNLPYLSYIHIVYMFFISFFTLLISKYFSQDSKTTTTKNKLVFVLLLIFLTIGGVIASFNFLSIYLIWIFPFSLTLLTYTISSFYISTFKKNIKYIIGLLFIFFVPEFFIQLLNLKEIDINIVDMKNIHFKTLIAFQMSMILLFSFMRYIQSKNSKKNNFLFIVMATLLIFPLFNFSFASILITLILLVNYKLVFQVLKENKLLVLFILTFLPSFFFISIYHELISYIVLVYFIMLTLTYLFIGKFLYSNITSIDNKKKVIQLFLLLFFAYSSLILLQYKIHTVKKAIKISNVNISAKKSLISSFNYSLHKLQYIDGNQIDPSLIAEFDRIVNEIPNATLHYPTPENIQYISVIDTLSNIILFLYEEFPICNCKEDLIANKMYRQLLKDTKNEIDKRFKNRLENYLQNSKIFILPYDDTNVYMQRSNMDVDNQFSYIVYKWILETRLKKIEQMSVKEFVQISDGKLTQGSTTQSNTYKKTPKYEIRGDSLYEIGGTRTTYRKKANKYAYHPLILHNSYCAEVDVKIKVKFTYNPFSPDGNEEGAASFISALGGIYEALFRAAVADATNSTLKEAYKDFGVKYASNKITLAPGETNALTVTLDTDGLIRDSIEMKTSQIEGIQVSTSDYNCKRDTSLKMKIKILEDKIYL